MESDRVRQIVAAIVGIFVIILLVLFARWTGDKIRERFLTPKPVTKIAQTVPTSVEPTQPEVSPASTVSAIPSTGPADFGYYLLGLSFLAGTILRLRTVVDKG